MLYAPRKIILHLLSPFLVACEQELLAVTCRGPEIRRQNSIATIGKELSILIVTPVITPPWATMRKYDERKIVSRQAFRQSEKCRDFETVGRLVTNSLH